MRHIADIYNDLTASRHTAGYDCHVHLFDQLGRPLPPTGIPHSVGFADIDLSCGTEQDIITAAYDTYIATNYNPNNILLATAQDSDTIIRIHKEHPNIIKGFGELKCYTNYGGKQLPYHDTDWFDALLKYNSALATPLPVYIHYAMNNDTDAEAFGKMVEKYQNIPILLCHCGLQHLRQDTAKAFRRTIDLYKNHTNLWVDVSYAAFDFFDKNDEALTTLLDIDDTRVVAGTDLNPKCYDVAGTEEYIQRQKEGFNKYAPLVHSDRNIKKLFNLQ